MVMTCFKRNQLVNPVSIIRVEVAVTYGGKGTGRIAIEEGYGSVSRGAVV